MSEEESVVRRGNKPTQRHRRLLYATLVGLIPIAPGVIGLGSLGLHHGDEANYIQVAVHMRETGNYLVPVYHDRLVLDRTPPFYWLVVLSFELFGPELWAARLPSLLGFGGIAAWLYAYMVRNYNDQRQALLAALAISSSLIACQYSRLAVPDMLMTLGVLVATTQYVQAAKSFEQRKKHLFLASVGVGIAGLVKAHVGAVVALLPLLVFTCVNRHSPRALRLRELASPVTWLPATTLCSWWYVFLLSSSSSVADYIPGYPTPSQGGETLRAALLSFFVAEARHQIEGGWAGLIKNIRAYWFGPFTWFFPWLAIVVIGFFAGKRHLLAELVMRPQETRMWIVTILSVYALFTFLVLEIRAPRYLLPAGPAIAILASLWLGARARERPNARLTGPLALAVALLLLWSTFFGMILPRTTRPDLEDLCRDLRRDLQPADTVASVALPDTWSTFAMVLLGRDIAVNTNIASASERLRNELKSAFRRGGRAYVLTRAEAAGAVEHALGKKAERRRSASGGWLAERRAFWEKIVALEFTQ